MGEFFGLLHSQSSIHLVMIYLHSCRTKLNGSIYQMFSIKCVNWSSIIHNAIRVFQLFVVYMWQQYYPSTLIPPPPHPPIHTWAHLSISWTLRTRNYNYYMVCYALISNDHWTFKCIYSHYWLFSGKLSSLIFNNTWNRNGKSENGKWNQ